MGTEVQLVSSLAIRGGYLTSATKLQTNSNSAADNITGFVGGIGLSLFNYTLDYAITPLGTLGETHRFSLKTSF